MFTVGQTLRDKRTGEVIAVTDFTLSVRWDDGIERDHPLIAAQDTFELLEPMSPEEAPGAVTAQPPEPDTQLDPPAPV